MITVPEVFLNPLEFCRLRDVQWSSLRWIVIPPPSSGPWNTRARWNQPEGILTAFLTKYLFSTRTSNLESIKKKTKRILSAEFGVEFYKVKVKKIEENLIWWDFTSVYPLYIGKKIHYFWRTVNWCSHRAHCSCHLSSTRHWERRPLKHRSGVWVNMQLVTGHPEMPTVSMI